MRLKNDVYTVAWISALPVELAAARVFLDDVHDPPEAGSTDQNSYILGRVHRHNVVIACLPSGVYGVVSAATTLALMRSTFPSLQFGLIVGVGGGVPSPADVRLGDVVVGIPTPSSAGVIQYDYGKALPGGRIQRTGSLNKPPQCLLTAVSQVRSGEMLGETTLHNTVMSATLKLSMEARETFSKPDTDRLFRPEYTHQRAEADCAHCDEPQLVHRLRREKPGPYVHYGVIASGNQVIKDAITRDTIAQETGVLCFEMEAAGLMDQLPCLVVRGICDYCDSHKNKRWQGYAALAASAYAYTILELVPPTIQRSNDTTTQKGHWMVPFTRNRRFTGRQHELARLEELLMRRNEPSNAAIYGLGGVGKTQIALEMAYRIRENDPTCSIFWITCTGYESIEQDFANIAAAIGMADSKPVEAKEWVKNYLSRKSSEKWLLIFDNADDTDIWINGNSVTPPLKSILPRSETGSILFTTRNRKLAVRLASSDILSIPSMDEHTATEMLTKSLAQKDMVHDIATTTRLLEQLSFLPLAITQAAAYINANNISISDYLSLLKEHEQSAIELLSENWDDEERSQNAVATTWWVSFQQIQQLDELAAEYLSFMACINSRAIPPTILPIAPSPKRRMEALGLLNAYSFISGHAQDSSFSLHRLVHLAIRDWMRNNKTLTIWVRRTADHLDKVFPCGDHESRYQWQTFLPHALYLTTSAEFNDCWEEYDELLLRIGACLRYEGRLKEAKALFVKLLELNERTLGSTHPHTLTSVDFMGLVLQELGEYQLAESMHQRALDVRNEVLGLEHADTLGSLGNLGLALVRQGKYKESEAMHRQALDVRNHILGPENPDTLASLENLGAAVALQGKYKEAEVLARQTFEARKRISGLKHPDTLLSMSQLGYALERQVKYKEAEDMHRQCLLESEEVLGREHPQTLTQLVQLGSVLESQGQYEEAESIYQRALWGREKVFGPDHPNTLSTISRLGFVCEQQGRYPEAEALHRQALERREKLFGPLHPETLESVCYLGSVFAEQGRYDEAEMLHRRDVAVSEEILGRDHPSTLSSLTYLADVLRRQSRHHEAEPMYRRAFEGLHRLLGVHHPYTLFARQRLVQTLEAMGKEPDIDLVRLLADSCDH